MAFDQPTRNRLQRFVTEARAALEEEFTRQLQNDYGMDPASGTVAPLASLRHIDDLVSVVEYADNAKPCALVLVDGRHAPIGCGKHRAPVEVALESHAGALKSVVASSTSTVTPVPSGCISRTV